MKNSIRITSGRFRGRKISTPGGKTHPMGERERLALFNMIAEYLPSCSVLDAFAGSGALGIEALSRGAGSVLFIEQNSGACEAIRSNLSEIGIKEDIGEVIRGDVYNYLASGGQRFDVVLADPPYDDYDETRIVSLVDAVAEPNGILVLSHPGESPEMPGMKALKTRKYAAANISIYTR